MFAGHSHLKTITETTSGARPSYRGAAGGSPRSGRSHAKLVAYSFCSIAEAWLFTADGLLADFSLPKSVISSEAFAGSLSWSF